MWIITFIQIKLNSILIQIHKADLIKKYKQASPGLNRCVARVLSCCIQTNINTVVDQKKKWTKMLIYEQRKNLFSSCPVYSGVCVQFPLQLFILYSQWSNILSVLSSPPTRVTPRHSTSDAGKPVCLFICSTLIIHTAMFSSVLYTLNTNYSASWLCSRSAPSTADLSLFSSVLACKFVSLVLFSYCWFRDLVKGVCFA